VSLIQGRLGSVKSCALRHRNVHVLHGNRSVYQEGNSRRQGMRNRKMQRALMQSFKPENYFEVGEALI
jgi:hypothetical protein